MDENKTIDETIVFEEATAEDMTHVIVEEVSEADEVAKRIAELEKQAAENLERYQRVFAEFDNFRKRTSREKASMYDDGVRDTVEQLLVVLDTLERATATQEGKGEMEEDAFFKGVQMTLKQFQEVLRSVGVTPIASVGEQFDPNLHAAIAHEDDENYGANEIVQELQKGYQYKDKVVRHSMVKVVN